MNAAIVQISEEMILEWLDFKGGTIRSLQFGIRHGVLEVVIEHPDMPQARDGQMYRTVHPIYTRTDGCPPTIERSDPPKVSG